MNDDFKRRLLRLLQALSEQLRMLPRRFPRAPAQFRFNDELWRAAQIGKGLRSAI